MTVLQQISEWRERRRVLRDDRTIQKQSDFYVRRHVEDRIQAAKNILETGDRETPLVLWQEVRAKCPDLVMESRAGLVLLIALCRFDDAEALMQEGCKRQPHNPFFCEGAALLAARRGDDEEAVRRYSVLRRRFPRELRGYTDMVEPLARLGRLDEADRIFGKVAYKVHDVGLKTAHANLAMRRKDWATALKRWKKLLKGVDFGNAAAWQGVAQCYREMEQFDEAEQIIVEALKRPGPDAIVYRTELARVSESKGDWSEAARLWNDIRRRAPSISDAYFNCVTALEKCGRDDEADPILHEATQRFPTLPKSWIEYAKLADRLGNAQDAEQRWEQVHARFPKSTRAPAV